MSSIATVNGKEAPGHVVSITRFQRGMTPISPSRPVYGYELRCTCGWKGRTNERKPGAAKYARDHLRDYVPNKLKIKSVYVFAFDARIETPDDASVVGHMTAWTKDDIEVHNFIAKHQALGHAVGVFYGKQAWH